MAQKPENEFRFLSMPDLSIRSYAIPFNIPGGQRDRQLLHYFCVRGASELSGYLSSEFWTRVVLQRSHDQLAVRQAVVALSCAHRGFVSATHDDINDGGGSPDGSGSGGGGGGGGVSDEANLIYMKALRSLRKYLNAGIDDRNIVSPVVPLICCVLFYCFESARNNLQAALQHLHSGVSILKRYKRERVATAVKLSADEEVELCLLEQVFTRLDLQASMFDDGRLPLLEPGLAEHNEAPFYLSPDPFRSIDEAQLALTDLQNWGFHLMMPNCQYKFCQGQQLPPHVQHEKARVMEAYARWWDKFEGYCQNRRHTQDGSGDRASDELGIKVLRIHFLIFRSTLEHSLPYNPMVFNPPPCSPYRRAIDTILDLAETLIFRKPSSPGGFTDSGRHLSAETGIVAPLFLLAMKCEDGAVVERALSLLSACRRREGLYDSSLVVDIARTIMLNQVSQVPPQLQGYYDEAPLPSALEFRAGDAIEIRENGVDGIAKNLGLLPKMEY